MRKILPPGAAGAREKEPPESPRGPNGPLGPELASPFVEMRISPATPLAALPHADPGRPPPTAKAPASSRGAGASLFWGEDGFSFADLLDLINPLQHVPIIASVYRAITHDRLAAGPRLLGGAALGGLTAGAGPLLGAATGLAAAAFDSVLQRTTGKDLGAHVLAFFFDPEKPAPTVLARRTEDAPAGTKPPQSVRATEGVPAEARQHVPPPLTQYAVAAILDRYERGLELARARDETA